MDCLIGNYESLVCDLLVLLTPEPRAFVGMGAVYSPRLSNLGWNLKIGL